MGEGYDMQYTEPEETHGLAISNSNRWAVTFIVDGISRPYTDDEIFALREVVEAARVVAEHPIFADLLAVELIEAEFLRPIGNG